MGSGGYTGFQAIWRGKEVEIQSRLAGLCCQLEILGRGVTRLRRLVLSFHERFPRKPRPPKSGQDPSM